MRAMRHRIWFNLCFFAITLTALAQERKPGLYELTLTTVTISPSPVTYPPRVSHVCLTQEMIDKYGAIVPDSILKTCRFNNVLKKPGGTTAEIVCSGSIAGKGTLDVHWSDSEHAKGNIHFSGTIHPGESEIKMEWNALTSSVYKGADCSLIAPATTPPAVLSPSQPPGQ
jgi:hypothetical protein